MVIPSASDLRKKLRELLGPSFQRKGLGNPEFVSTTPYGSWQVDDLLFETPDGEKVPAYFLRPADGSEPVPAVIYAHAHGNRYSFGRDELLEGRPTLQGAYAKDLMDVGIAALCIEMPCFGQRQTPDESTRSKANLWRGDTLFGQMLSEQSAGIDFLAEHPLIDTDRIGTLGFSMGSTLAFWLAALDTRIKAVSALCSLADLETLVEQEAHDGHGIYMSVPGLFDVARTGEIAGLVAPRGLQICAGLQDWSTPKTALDIGLKDVTAAYETQLAMEGLDIFIEPDAGHEETAEMRARVLNFLKQNL